MSKMTFDEFTNLVNHHDLTFEYSNDHSVWLRGSAELAKIKAEAKNFPIEDVKRVWTAMVDKFLVPEARENFYWKG